MLSEFVRTSRAGRAVLDKDKLTASEWMLLRHRVRRFAVETAARGFDTQPGEIAAALTANVPALIAPTTHTAILDIIMQALRDGLAVR